MTRLLGGLPTLAWLLVCALAAANVWLGPGIVNTRMGGDSPFLLIRTFELAENLKAGVFPARWMANAAFGLGYPFFNFYAALPYYLAAALHALGVDLLSAIKLTQTLGMIAAGAAMARLAEDLLPRADARAHRWAVAVAAAAYAVTPFHLANIYVRGDSLSEFWAFVWYPLILWSIHQLVAAWADPRGAGRRWAHLIGLALGLAGLVLTHNVSALIFAPFAALYALARQAVQPMSLGQQVGTLAALAGAAGWALGLSAWFWLPALGEANQVQLDAQTTGYFYFANHFRAENLVQLTVLFDYSVDRDLDAFAIGGPHALATLIGAAIWLWAARRAGQPLYSWLLIVLGCALSAFMITPLSTAIWAHAPLLPLAQFPWRFLSVQACFGALLIGGVGLAGPMVGRITLRMGRITLRPNSGAVAVLTMVVLGASGLARLPNARLEIQAGDVSPRTIQLYEWYTGNIGTTIRHEYLPATALPVPRTGPELLGLRRAAVIAADGVAEEVVRSALRTASPAGQRWEITAQRAVTIALPMLYWPAWQVWLDGQAWPSWPHPGSGWLALAVPAGSHQVEVRWTGTPLTRLAELASALAWLGLVALVVWRVGQAAAATHRRIAGQALVALGLIGAAIGLSRLLSPPYTPPPLQTLDFERRPFPHRAPVRFSGAGEAYTLIGATIEPATLRPGQPFTLTLRWQDDRAPAQITTTQELPMGAETVRLFRHARLEIAGNPRISRQVVITGALPGPLLLKLNAVDARGQVLSPLDAEGLPQTALIAGGPSPAITLVGPTILSEGPDQAGDVGRLNLSFGNGIVLHDADWLFISAHEACLRPIWRRDGAGGNRADALQSSLRIYSSDGDLIVQADGQPQAGLAPTWAWPHGALVYDSFCLPVKRMLRSGEPYTMQIVWYRLFDLRPTGELRLRGVNAGQVGHLNLPVAMSDSGHNE